MPLDKVLIDHLDEQDILEESIEKDIDDLINAINPEDIIADSYSYLIDIVNNINELLKSKYYIKASENGIKLAKDIVRDGDIKIADSTNPNLNEGLIDASNGESKN